jgi:hypothetical protein
VTSIALEVVERLVKDGAWPATLKPRTPP